MSRVRSEQAAVSVRFPVTRLVALVASGAVHATVFASLASTTPGNELRAAESILILETEEVVPTPPVARPEETENTTRPASHEGALHPRVTRTDQERPAAAPDFLAQFMAVPPAAANVPTDEDGRGAVSDGEGAAASPAPETTYGEDDVSTPAKLLSNVNAAYPMPAWSSGIEADVPVEIVVDARGSVASARVVTRAGHGFDDAALESIKSYRFAAAQRDGHAVRVRVRWSIQFRLRR
jgi:TonB family protein